MYNLKSVYGIISFDKTKVNVLVVEKTNTEKINCLFYDYEELDYLDENLEFKDRVDLTSKILNLLTKADNFIGTIVKRYIVNISFLPIRIIRNTSNTFSLVSNQVLTAGEYKNLIKQISVLDNSQNEQIISINPYSWNLDGKFYKKFPLGNQGHSLKFEYVAYAAQTKLFEEFKSLISDCKIKPMAFVNNQISYCGLINSDHETKKNLVVDIKSDHATINFYDEHNQLVYYERTDLGSNWLVDKIKNQFSIDSSKNISPLIDSLKYVNLVDNSIGLINIHKPDFLGVKVATASALTAYIKMISKNYLDAFNSRISAITARINLNYDNMYINSNNIGKSILSLTNDNNEYFFKTNIIGIEDKNIANLIGAINYVNSIQKQTDQIVYSIDPYVSENLENEQFKDNLLLKIGIITTKWAAKLGGDSDGNGIR